MAEESKGKKPPTSISIGFILPNSPITVDGRIKYELHRLEDGEIAETGWYSEDEEAPEGFEYHGSLDRFPSKALGNPEAYAAGKNWANWYRQWFIRQVRDFRRRYPLLPELTERASVLAPLLRLSETPWGMPKSLHDLAEESAVALERSFHGIRLPSSSALEALRITAEPHLPFSGFEMAKRAAELAQSWPGLPMPFSRMAFLPFEMDRLALSEITRQDDRLRFEKAIIILSSPNSSEEERCRALEELKHQRERLRNHVGPSADYIIDAGESRDWPRVFQGCLFVAQKIGIRKPIHLLGSSKPVSKPNTLRKRAKPAHVSRRQGIVKRIYHNEPDLHGTRLNADTCRKLDQEGIKVPDKWTRDFSATKWLDSLSGPDPKLRARVKTLLRKDRLAP